MGFRNESWGRVGLRFRGLILVVLCALTLCACRDASEKAPPPRVKITIAYPATFLSVLYQIASINGFFLAEGLEVAPDIHEFGRVALDSMLAGNADLVITADTPVMHAITGGRDMSIIAVTATSRRAIGLVARKDRGIVHPPDLKGKTIGVAMGSTGDYFLDSFLSTRGMDRRELTVVDLRPGEMLDALLSGRVDGVTVWNPTLVQLKRELGANGIVFRDEVIYSDIACIAAGAEFVRRNPETVKSVLKALIKAEAFVKKHPEQSRRVIADFLKMDVAVVEEIWDSYHFRVTLDQALIISLEDQTRWAQQRGLTGRRDMPNYLAYVYFDGLLSVKPEAVRIMR